MEACVSDILGFLGKSYECDSLWKDVFLYVLIKRKRVEQFGCVDFKRKL